MQKNEQYYCDFCGDEIKELQPENRFLMSVGNFYNETHYCDKCKDMWDKIFNDYLKRTHKLEQTKNYIDYEKEFKLIESYYKSKPGNLIVQFKNNNYTKDIINSPIILDDIPVGFITGIDEEKVTGLIWERHIPIVPQILDGKVTSFEIIY